MRSHSWAALAGGVALLLLPSGMQARQGTQPVKLPVTPVADANSPGPDHFVGLWDYNADQSVDAATGRKEQNPRTSQRRGAATSNAPAAGYGGMAGAPYPGYGGNSGLGVVYVNEMRELERDLLEVPEKLRIVVTSDAVTFTDDLDRSRVYPTDNKKHKYQLGAAVFHAKVLWDGHQLKREIEGAEAFKMHETYFLSEDGQRLFVVLRVGDQERLARTNTPLHGYNRIYDRVKE
jgi:hypothetical protein